MLLELSGSHREGTAFLYFTPIVHGHEHRQALQALIGYGALTASSLCLRDLCALRLWSLAFFDFASSALCSGNIMVLAVSGLFAAVLQT